LIKVGSSLSESSDQRLVHRLIAQLRGPLLEQYADNLDNTGDKIAERVSVWRESDKHGVHLIDLTAYFDGSAKDNRAEFDAWLRRELIKAAHTVVRTHNLRSGNPSDPSASVDGDSTDREDNPAKFRTEQYDGSTEKRIYPEDIAKVYPALRGAMRSLTKHERGEVINLLWSFIAATIEESPILQKAGWVVGREPDGDNFAVYYETCPRGQSFEDIIEQDAILAVQEAAGGRSDNPRKSGLPLGSVALGAALGAAAMHFTMKPKQ
jgi:hypothetical protein